MVGPTLKSDLALNALGSQTRRDILAMLGVRPMTVGSIAERLPISRPAVSKHLRILRQAGLVSYNPDGRRNVFYLQPAGFREAQGYLDRFWDEALASLERYVEDRGQAGR